MYQVDAPDKVIGSFILGTHPGWEPAPEGFTPENAGEWVKADGVWVRDKAEADRIRQALEG